jgi:hypothetical protein
MHFIPFLALLVLMMVKGVGKVAGYSGSVKCQVEPHHTVGAGCNMRSSCSSVQDPGLASVEPSRCITQVISLI